MQWNILNLQKNIIDISNTEQAIENSINKMSFFQKKKNSTAEKSPKPEKTVSLDAMS